MRRLFGEILVIGVLSPLPPLRRFQQKTNQPNHPAKEAVASPPWLPIGRGFRGQGEIRARCNVQHRPRHAKRPRRNELAGKGAQSHALARDALVENDILPRSKRGRARCGFERAAQPRGASPPRQRRRWSPLRGTSSNGSTWHLGTSSRGGWWRRRRRGSVGSSPKRQRPHTKVGRPKGGRRARAPGCAQCPQSAIGAGPSGRT